MSERIQEIARRAGGSFVITGFGFLLALIGLADDWYQHEILGFSPALESFYAPVHLMIFGGVIVAGFGYLWSLARVNSSIGRARATLEKTPSRAKP
jgi:hypothetical protein